ncbi:MAG: DUF4258 domain-containing protein [Smithella sp.]|jgi:hypothetical protein|nr:DUF4258 domain-containing protein [Smithella sp.]
MNWRWTQHILLQLKERDISKDLIEDALKNPDSKTSGTGNRIIYQKLSSGKLLRIVTEGDLLITAYITDKISKYVKEVK